MAEQLKSFEFISRRSARFPWSEWMNGCIWRVKRDVDFTTRADSFRSELHRQAFRLRKTVQTRIVDEKTIVFQFSDKSNEDTQ